MKTRIAFAFIVTAALVTTARAGDPSGPPVGEGAPTFDAVDVTGPHKGETLCHV